MKIAIWLAAILAGTASAERVRVERRSTSVQTRQAPSPAPAAAASPAPSNFDRSVERREPGRTYIYRQRRTTIQAPSAPAAVPSGRARIAYPERDGRGARVVQPAATAPPPQHTTIIRSPGVVREIRDRQRVETTPGRYYWHDRDGVRYSHYYDGRDHWYGFYHGPHFYWTRWYGDRWWWYDARFSRWDYWWDGYWWWPAPGGVAFVYMNNGYYPYNPDGRTIEEEDSVAAPAAPAPNQGSSTASPDGKRLVQVLGDEGQAFLYDKTRTPPRFLKFLGQGVSRARFSGGTGGAPLQLLLEFKDDSFALYDADGDSLSSAVKATRPASAPPPPENIPPPPTSAPGE